ncbi:hypothetical protein B0H16DRAFT_90040 [Mycena metata]|uniref:Uncharacterized protein n=1 Tax=Mycena metata TaxID=1033252 RepID=A0AAD7IB07_9AGAR|nr:hypothetical protein B0H16DRAFT_90040 [Mycena metata]
MIRRNITVTRNHHVLAGKRDCARITLHTLRPGGARCLSRIRPISPVGIARLRRSMCLRTRRWHSCVRKHAEVAREHGRYAHERIFKILQALFPEYGNCEDAPAMSSLVVKMVSRIHSELSKMKDLQMLAMLSMIVLQGCRDARTPAKNKSPDLQGTPTTAKSGAGAMDYFSTSRSSSGGNTGHISPVSPTWPRLAASPPVPSQATLLTSNSSRGSWSSLFNTSGAPNARFIWQFLLKIRSIHFYFALFRMAFRKGVLLAEIGPTLSPKRIPRQITAAKEEEGGGT